MKRRYLRSATQLGCADALMLPISGTPLDGPVLGWVFTGLLASAWFYVACWLARELGAWGGPK